MIQFENTEAFAKELDARDPLASFRDKFAFPEGKKGNGSIYLCGNSLGLMPKKAKEYVSQEIADWERFAVEGHFEAKTRWYSYAEQFPESLGRLVGAKPTEVVAMNSLTVNLHLLLISFYRPVGERGKILIESSPFPSDRYAVESQIRFHGRKPEESLRILEPRNGEETLRTEDILDTIEKEGDQIALVLLGGVNYLTGQAFELDVITKAAQRKGAVVALDLAHAAGNLELKLHDLNVDFAVWCSYKYLNSGPGALAGAFVHERHHGKRGFPRLEGWWGNRADNRFEMKPTFDSANGAAAWAQSNPPILSAAPLKASLEVFDATTMAEVRKKGDLLTGYLEYLIKVNVDETALSLITPTVRRERGAQLSYRMARDAEAAVKALRENGYYCDFRRPDIFRVAPVPFYNSFMDLYNFSLELKKRWPSKK